MYRGHGMRVEGTYESAGSVGVTVGVVVSQDGGPAYAIPTDSLMRDDQRGQLAGSAMGSMVYQVVEHAGPRGAQFAFGNDSYMVIGGTSDGHSPPIPAVNGVSTYAGASPAYTAATPAVSSTGSPGNGSHA